MRWLRSDCARDLGLFVDDGSFAVAILVWLGLAVAVLPRVAARRAVGWASAVRGAGGDLDRERAAIRATHTK